MGVSECHCPYMTRTEGGDEGGGGGAGGGDDVCVWVGVLGMCVCECMCLDETHPVNSTWGNTGRTVRERQG